jgi:hypothetical protein
MTRHPVAADPTASLYQGAPAVAFALRAAAQSAYLPVLATLDRHIAEITHRRLQRAHARIDRGELPELREFDLINGLTGIGVYLLAASQANLLHDVLTYLVRLTSAITVNGHAMPGWWTDHGPFRPTSPAMARRPRQPGPGPWHHRAVEPACHHEDPRHHRARTGRGNRPDRRIARTLALRHPNPPMVARNDLRPRLDNRHRRPPRPTAAILVLRHPRTRPRTPARLPGSEPSRAQNASGKGIAQLRYRRLPTRATRRRLALPRLGRARPHHGTGGGRRRTRQRAGS